MGSAEAGQIIMNSMGTLLGLLVALTLLSSAHAFDCKRYTVKQIEISGNQTGNMSEIFRTTKTHRGVLPSTSLTTQHVQACNLLAADGTCPTKIQCSAGEATSFSSKLMTQNPECFVSMRSLPAIIQHTASKG